MKNLPKLPDGYMKIALIMAVLVCVLTGHTDAAFCFGILFLIHCE